MRVLRSRAVRTACGAKAGRRYAPTSAGSRWAPATAASASAPTIIPQGRVTDHRIGLTLYRIEDIMEGDLDELISALTLADQEARMAKEL